MPRVEAGPSEAMLVYDATHALRSGDGARAGELAEECLRRYPGGSLAEEAEVVRMKAAAARDDARAAQFAEAYLRDHPNGRYRADAERLRRR